MSEILSAEGPTTTTGTKGQAAAAIVGGAAKDKGGVSPSKGGEEVVGTDEEGRSDEGEGLELEEILRVCGDIEQTLDSRKLPTEEGTWLGGGEGRGGRGGDGRGWEGRGGEGQEEWGKT